MKTTTTLLLAAALGLAQATAGERTIVRRPFTVSHAIQATALTAEAKPLSLVPRIWRDFEIARIVAHGTKVKRGETLVCFDPRGIDEAIADLRLAVRRSTLQQADAAAHPREAAKLEESGAADRATQAQRQTAKLADLEADRAMFEFKAAADGWFVYGSLQDGMWKPADADLLAPFRKVAPGIPFALLLPADASPVLRAAVDAATATALRDAKRGIAEIPGREDRPVEVALSSRAEMPGVDGRFLLEFSGTWPEGAAPRFGTKATIHIVSHHNPAAIVLPASLPRFGPDGWSVKVRLANGRSESRRVTRGLSCGAETEILGGLEPGQVIVE
jgi:hypothetical protein